MERFALEITRFLRDCGVKMVIMACNISSAVALQSARERFSDMSILGVVEAGARAGLSASRNGKIGVLATAGAVLSGAYPCALRRISPDTDVRQQPCPAFVPLVEAGQSDSPEARAAASVYLEAFRNDKVETVILGCTHYPFLLPALKSVGDGAMRFVDPSQEAACEARHYLEARNLLSEARSENDLFYVSGDRTGFVEQGSRFLGRPIETIFPCRWNESQELEALD
ncbi:MAG: aspartate/glutamate racemase family protein [Armatimonadetes bacterium]|nr:aspartate/glutamate racemase family protein [Armatimonadota bacterium]